MLFSPSVAWLNRVAWRLWIARKCQIGGGQAGSEESGDS